MKTKELIKKLEVVYEQSTLGDIPIINKELEHDAEFFTSTRVHRDDLEGYYKNFKKLSDEDMEALAGYIHEATMNSGVYWDAIQSWVDLKEQEEKDNDK